MFSAWQSRSNYRTVPRGHRTAALRPQVEMLENRLAPSATLPPLPVGTLPPAFPRVEAAWDSSPTTHQTNALLTIDLVALGLSGANRIEIVFHSTPNPLATPVLQYFDVALNSWRPVQGSTQIEDSLLVNADQGTLTVIFDATSNPALANLQGTYFRLTGDGVLTSAIPVASGSTASAAILRSVDAVFASRNFDALPAFSTDTRPLDDHGVGLYYVDHATIDVVASAQTASGQADERSDIQPASASEPTAPPADESRPPMEPNSPESASNSFTFHAPVLSSMPQAAQQPSESFVLALGLPRDVLVQRVVVRGGSGHTLLVAMVFGWTSIRKDLREKPAWKRMLASCWPCTYAGRTKRQHHPATVPRAPPHLGRQRNGKGQTAWSALFSLASRAP